MGLQPEKTQVKLLHIYKICWTQFLLSKFWSNMFYADTWLHIISISPVDYNYDSDGVHFFFLHVCLYMFFFFFFFFSFLYL